MNRCYVDANTWIYYIDARSNQHGNAKETIKEIYKVGFHPAISSLVFDEVVYNYSKILKGPDRFKKIGIEMEKILSLPDIEILQPDNNKESHLMTLRFMNTFKLSPRDTFHLKTMIDNRIFFMVTFDKDFDKIFEAGMIRKLEAPTLSVEDFK